MKSDSSKIDRYREYYSTIKSLKKRGVVVLRYTHHLAGGFNLKATMCGMLVTSVLGKGDGSDIDDVIYKVRMICIPWWGYTYRHQTDL